MNKPLSPDLKNNFLDLANQLSPENLSCDGEASSSYVRSRYNALKTEWSRLEDIVGRKVTEGELYR